MQFPRPSAPALLACLAFDGALGATALAAEPGSGQQSLGQAANDPTASLMSVPIRNNYSGTFHRLGDADANTLQLRIAAAFQALGLGHIARATLPFPTHTPSGASGMGDLTLLGEKGARPRGKRGQGKKGKRKGKRGQARFL